MRFGRFTGSKVGEGHLWSLNINLDEVLMVEFQGKSSSGPYIKITFRSGLEHMQYLYGIDVSHFYKRLQEE